MFMNLFECARAGKGTMARPTRRPIAAFRPRVESLEERAVPTVISYHEDLTNNVAIITANDAADNIVITDPGNGSATVSGPGITGVKPIDAQIRTIRVITNGGADSVRYDLTGTTARSMKLDVDLGSGNDTFLADLHGKNIDNFTTLNLKVQGGWGSDSLTVDAYGTSDDRVHVRYGSILRMELLGGSDFDPFDGADTINVDYRGDMDGYLIFKAVGGQGHDNIDALLTLSAGSGGRVKGDGNSAARMEGGQGADNLDFRVRDYSGGSAGVSAVVDGGADWDYDTVRHTTNVQTAWVTEEEDIVVT
jgi:hypothetical protein